MASAGSNSTDRGAWAGDDQATTVRQAWASLPIELDENADIVRAARAFARSIKQRSENPAANDDDGNFPAIAIVSANWRILGKQLGWQLLPIVDDGSQRLSGRVFVAPPNLTTAYFAEIPCGDLAKIFEWIEQLGIGAESALILNPAATAPEIRIYEQGMVASERIGIYPLCLSALDLADLDRLLQRFYHDMVCAPSAKRPCRNLWADAAKFKSVPRPEKAIQEELYKFLHISLPGLNVEEEEDTLLGRLDLRLSGPTGQNDNSHINHALIELKVVNKGNAKAPFTDTKAVKQHLEDGTRQAMAYRSPPNSARIAMMCCYDMRPHAGKRGESCLLHVRTFAKDNAVELRRWPLFPTVEQLREHLFPNKAPN